MTEKSYNPFTNRLSRDLRNDLSEALTHAILTGDSLLLDRKIEEYMGAGLDQDHRNYLDQRCKKYREALAKIDHHHKKPMERAVVLWNLGLFFEVHEILEHAWYEAEGPMRESLQAMIRAAGVYIKMEFGYEDAAERIAAKAVIAMEKNTRLFAEYFDPLPLIAALKTKGPAPLLSS